MENKSFTLIRNNCGKQTTFIQKGRNITTTDKVLRSDSVVFVCVDDALEIEIGCNNCDNSIAECKL